MASQVSDAFATKERIRPEAVWKDGFLPPASDRDLFKIARK
jgi:NitT/TauT family transport system substrate-binding protein